MSSEISVHDNVIYAYQVDCEGRRLILHTVFEDREPNEFTDVVFGNTIAHYFEHVLPGNILFDIEEVEVGAFVRDREEIFVDSRRYGWPPIEFDGDIESLVASLQATSAHAYLVNSSYGMSGWVLAGSCERLSRAGRAKLS